MARGDFSIEKAQSSKSATTQLTKLDSEYKALLQLNNKTQKSNFLKEQEILKGSLPKDIQMTFKHTKKKPSIP